MEKNFLRNLTLLWFYGDLVVFVFFGWLQILGGIAGNLDARKACKEALKIHEKFLKKVTTCFDHVLLFLLLLTNGYVEWSCRLIIGNDIA